MIVSWLLSKLRSRRYALQRTNGKQLIFGCIYSMRYSNWKRDPNPLILVLYSGPRTFVHVSGHYTDGINLHYLNMSDKMWLAKTIYLIKKGSQQMQPHLFYRFLKMNRPNIARTAYRRYHSNMIIQPRMVSAGWTHFDRMVYPFNDPWITQLNKTLQPAEINFTKVKVAYSPTELTDRINTAINARPITTLSVNNPVSTTNVTNINRP